MVASPLDLAAQECRLARRVARLFKAERAGRFDRRPFATAQLLIERRGGLIAELIGIAAQRPRGASLVPPILAQALAELAHEADRLRGPIEQRLASIEAELGMRRSGTPATGLRRDAGGRLLGKG
jgi:hypothetical protein